jgi:hypothetical protein
MTLRIFCLISQRTAGIFSATLAAILFCISCRTTPQTPPVHAAIPPVENLLPADTLFFLAVPDCAALRTASHQSPQWLFWNDPAMKPFHDKFVAKWNSEFVGPLERDLGVKLSDFTDLPQGQLALAITQNGWNGTNDVDPGVLLLLDTRNKSDLLKTNLTRLRNKWTEAGKPLRTETLHGISFSVVPLSNNEVPDALTHFFPKRQPVREPGGENKPSPPGELFVGQFESLLIAGNSQKAIDTVSARLTGGSNPSLDNNSLFAADRLSQFHGRPLCYGWFNARNSFDVLAHLPPPESNSGARSLMSRVPWNKILGASGLADLKTVSFTCDQSREGVQANFFTSVPDTSREGIIKMIASVPKDASPPLFVPADAVKFWRWRVDGQQSWSALEKMFANISPLALNSLNSFLDIANSNVQRLDPNFDVRKNLIGNLGDDWMSYQKKSSGTTPADLNNVPSIFIFAASNPDQTALAIKNIMALASSQENPPQTRDFLGRKIYTIPLPSQHTPGTNAVTSHSLYCTVGGGYVALTTDVSMIETYLRSADSNARPLREITGLADAVWRVGGAGNGLFAYQNQRETVRAAFTALKNSSMDSPSSSGANAFGALPFASPEKILGGWMDFSLLPDYDRVAKYFYFTVCSGTVTTDGLSFKVFAPRPPQLPFLTN